MPTYSAWWVGLVIEPGARAKLRGMCMGDVTNHGGDLTISGTVSGALHGRSSTRVIPGAKISRYGEPTDPQTAEVPLPEAAELARTVIDDLAHARWAEVRARFDATMHDQLSEEELAAPWPQIAGLAGAYEGHGDTDVARAGDLTHDYQHAIELQAGEFVARTAFRDGQTIAGLYIRNPDVVGGAGGSAAK